MCVEGCSVCGGDITVCEGDVSVYIGDVCVCLGCLCVWMGCLSGGVRVDGVSVCGDALLHHSVSVYRPHF